ncbi:MAG TPA: helix-turn-helix transcriptional regulator, partial [Polyangiales bacterium]|nr:helix-turn-helix transcriptional regulator [Polyangiales bacterium]
MTRDATADRNIGAAVRRFRLSAGMTQAQLADAAGVATETLSRIETGRMTTISLALCDRLASSLGVATADLMR